MTVSASGRVLTPLLVFKGAPNGRIETKEFDTYPDDIAYASCQGNAWMDERVMHLWIKRILKTYIDQTPPGIVPRLLLDSYRCHMMKSTVNAIEDLGVEVEHIPGGCTSLCQPVDVGVNKPFKSRMRKLWEEWMISTGLHQGKIDPPTRKHIAEWCSVSSRDLPAQMVRNSWRHGMYSYYPPVPVQEDEPAADQRQEEEHAADDEEVDNFVRNQISNPVQQQANDDDESGDENDDGSDDEMLNNHSEPLLSYHEQGIQAHNQEQEEEERAAEDEEVNIFGNRNNNPFQQLNNEDDGSVDHEYYNSSSDGEMRNDSEPLLSYHEKDNQPPHTNHWHHVGKTNCAGTLLNNIIIVGTNSCTTSESLPPLPDTMQLVHLLQEVQHARRSEQQHQQDHSEPLHFKYVPFFNVSSFFLSLSLFLLLRTRTVILLAVGAFSVVTTDSALLLVTTVNKNSLTATKISGVLAPLCRTFRPFVHINHLCNTPII